MTSLQWCHEVPILCTLSHEARLEKTNKQYNIAVKLGTYRVMTSAQSRNLPTTTGTHNIQSNTWSPSNSCSCGTGTWVAKKSGPGARCLTPPPPLPSFVQPSSYSLNKASYSRSHFRHKGIAHPGASQPQRIKGLTGREVAFNGHQTSQPWKHRVQNLCQITQVQDQRMPQETKTFCYHRSYFGSNQTMKPAWDQTLRFLSSTKQRSPPPTHTPHHRGS